MTHPPVVLITQRVVVFPLREERGDYLDQRWFHLFQDLGVDAYAAPNNQPAAVELYTRIGPDLLVLSGGNNLGPLISRGAVTELADDVAEERDLVESALLALAERDGVAVLGVCRGAQLIAARMGALLHPDPRHAGTRHTVRRVDGLTVHSKDLTWGAWPQHFTVASHHHWVLPTASELPPELCAVAVADDETVEAFTDRGGQTLGIMWHPEREPSPLHPGRSALRRIIEETRSHKSGCLSPRTPQISRRE